jgi:hypothetical protein
MVWLAQCLLLLNRDDEAEQAFQRVLGRDSGNKDAQKGLEVIKARRDQRELRGE